MKSNNFKVFIKGNIAITIGYDLEEYVAGFHIHGKHGVCLQILCFRLQIEKNDECRSWFFRIYKND